MTLRLAALMGLGTLAVHQLRYLLGYQEHADAALAASGHAYLTSLVPAMAGVVLLALAGLIQAVARGASSPLPRFRRTWAGATLGLVAVYCMQELAEGAPLLGNGGWVALPVAFAIGLLIAVAMRGASEAGELVARRRPWTTPQPIAPPVPAVAPAATVPRSAARLALSARAPPAVSV